MKRLIKILLFVSIGFNFFSIWAVIRIRNNIAQGELMSKALGGEVNKTSWTRGLELFITKLKEKDKLRANKKYYYVNVWTTWCIPCVREIPKLDSLVGTLNKDVGYVFVSDQTDKVIGDCIKRKKFEVKNFVFLNDMNDFVSGICNERGIKSKSYPMVLIIDQLGKIYHYSIGSYENSKELKELAEIINKLP